MSANSLSNHHCSTRARRHSDSSNLREGWKIMSVKWLSLLWSEDDGLTVASAGPYADHLHLVPADNHASSTSTLNFYRPDAPPDAQPTVSRHWRQDAGTTIWQQIDHPKNLTHSTFIYNFLSNAVDILNERKWTNDPRIHCLLRGVNITNYFIYVQLFLCSLSHVSCASFYSYSRINKMPSCSYHLRIY